MASPLLSLSVDGFAADKFVKNSFNESGVGRGGGGTVVTCMPGLAFDAQPGALEKRSLDR